MFYIGVCFNINIYFVDLCYNGNKYNIESDIVAQEKIYEDNNAIGPNTTAGILYQLKNEDKVFYDISQKKYYDNRQNKD